MITHLRADACLLGDSGQQSGLVDRPRQGLLRVATDAQPHGIERGRSVHVVRRADRADVDIFAMLGKQFPEVGELLRVLELLRLTLAFERAAVDVADRDHVAKQGGVVGVAAPLSADADAGDVHPLVGGVAPGRPRAGGDEVADPGEGRCFKKRATR